MGLHVASIHAPDRGQANTNPGAFIIQDGWRFGVYRNSFARTTVYGARVFQLASGPYGSLSASLGVASGYMRKCETRTVHRWDYVGTSHVGGRRVTTVIPVNETSESCDGFSRGYLAPLGAFTYSAPFSVLGATPEISFMPGIKGHASVGHLAFKWSI
jgi:hypothetical protein